MPNYDFKTDLKISQKTEKQISEFLFSKFGIKTLEFCNNKDYDLKVDIPKLGIKTIEIKEDFSCQRTGNVGLEYECRGKPSGIETSKADYYLYKVHKPDGVKSLYIISTDKLKKMVENKLFFRTVVGGDVGSGSKNYLFKLNIIIQNFRHLADIS